MATHVPPPLGPSLHDVPSNDEYVCTRGTIDDWEHVRYGFRHVSPPRTIHTRRRTHTYMRVALCLILETIRTRIDFVMILREPTHTCVPLGIILLWSARARAPPDHYYRDLGILHSRCDQLSLALAESCSGGRSPVITSPRVSPPSDALCLPSPDSSSLKIVIVQETPPAILLIAVVFQRSAVTNHSFLAPDIATLGDSVQGSHLLLNRWESPSRGSPSPLRMFSLYGVPFSKWMGFTPRGSPPLQRMGFASWGSPSPKRMGFASRGSPYPMRMRVASRGSPLSNANGIRFKGVPFSKANGICFKGFPLSTATVFRFKGPCFISTSEAIRKLMNPL